MNNNNGEDEIPFIIRLVRGYAPELANMLESVVRPYYSQRNTLPARVNLTESIRQRATIYEEDVNTEPTVNSDIDSDSDGDSRSFDFILDYDSMTDEPFPLWFVENGLSTEDIEQNLKTIVYANIATEEEQGDKEECCICLDEYNPGDNLGELDCTHHFHHECIYQWLMEKNTCPLCNQIALSPN